MERITALAKNRGFVYPGSEIYGGLANAWDYGPLGVQMKQNIKQAWRKKFIQETTYNVELETAIFMNPAVWEASGHAAGFNDPMTDCRKCKKRFRADHLIDAYLESNGINESVDGAEIPKLQEYMERYAMNCPICDASDFTSVKQFNMMFKTGDIYLRPETAQGIFLNFLNAQRTSRKKIPFGVAQIGKAFRNEITPGNFIFRTREFEQMELEFFCESGTDMQWFEFWLDFCQNWLIEFGLPANLLRQNKHKPEKLAHYSKATTDIEFNFPFGWGELWGISHRGDFDLKQHSAASGTELVYFDGEKKYTPHCIEPSVSPDRLLLAFLLAAYEEEKLETDSRTVLRLNPAIAPIKVAVMPLSKKLAPQAEVIYADLRKRFVCAYDDAGQIGRRYRRQDEIGTPYCVTYDFESQTDYKITVRERDSMEQERISIDKLIAYLSERLEAF